MLYSTKLCKPTSQRAPSWQQQSSGLHHESSAKQSHQFRRGHCRLRTDSICNSIQYGRLHQKQSPSPTVLKESLLCVLYIIRVNIQNASKQSFYLLSNQRSTLCLVCLLLSLCLLNLCIINLKLRPSPRYRLRSLIPLKNVSVLRHKACCVLTISASNDPESCHSVARPHLEHVPSTTAEVCKRTERCLSPGPIDYGGS